MAYFGADIKNIIAEILEAKKSKGGVKNLYFVGCGGSLGALYPAKTFMEKECASIKSAWINSNEFVHSTPRDFGEILSFAWHVTRAIHRKPLRQQSWEKKRELLSLF